MVGTALLQVPSVGAIIHDAEGRILLQRRSSDGSWSLPAGAIDPGETPAEAVVREVWEETGLHVRPARLAALFSGDRFRHTYENGDRVEYMIALFECDVVGGALQGQDDETIELRYFDLEAMPPLAIDYPREIFRRDRDAPTYFDWEDAWLDRLR